MCDFSGEVIRSRKHFRTLTVIVRNHAGPGTKRGNNFQKPAAPLRPPQVSGLFHFNLQRNAAVFSEIRYVGFTPGYQVAKNPSYLDITDHYRRTHHVLEMLKPDIWLAQHNE